MVNAFLIGYSSIIFPLVLIATISLVLDSIEEKTRGVGHVARRFIEYLRASSATAYNIAYQLRASRAW